MSLSASIRRAAHLVKRTFNPPRARFIYSRRYEINITGVPLDPLRGARVLAYLALEGLIDRANVVEPETASITALLRVHTPEYIESLRQQGALTRILGIHVGDAETDHVIDLQRLMVGGTIEALRAAAFGHRMGVNLGGGFHHAHAHEGRGFCVFNDIAVAIHDLRAHGYRGRILVVDLDLHDGDGTRAIFARDESVYTFSIHNQTWFDDPATQSSCIELGHGVDDAIYLTAIERHLPRVIDEFDPALVVYLAGNDPARDDWIGDWKISPEGMLKRDQLVTNLVRTRGEKTAFAVLLAGGYSPNAWRHSSRFLGWALTGRVIEPPRNELLTMALYRITSSVLDPRELTSELDKADQSDWAITEEDITGVGVGGVKETRLLGYYTRIGVELALERYGFFNQLRALGFAEPCVDLDLEDREAQTIRIFGDRNRKELVCELRVRRDKRLAPGFECLFVEWLLLQNPRLSFDEKRPRLPGQMHPGLGMLDEVCGLLVMVCERLHLDGILFVPAHYNLAAVSHHILGFLHPRDEARFLAFREATQNLSLVEASWAIEDGRIHDTTTGEPARWAPAPMVLPVSTPMIAKHGPRALRDEAAKLATDFRFELLPPVKAETAEVGPAP